MRVAQRRGGVRGRVGEVARRNRFDRDLVDLPAAPEVFRGQPEVRLREIFAEVAGEYVDERRLGELMALLRSETPGPV